MKDFSGTVVIRPEECPEPFWHETHRYCPACSWVEPQEGPDRLTAAAEVIHGAHVGWIDAAGVTGDARGSAHSLGGPCDECKALARLLLEGADRVA
jgi:hypothetical protein